jgi:hypothetical protein
MQSHRDVKKVTSTSIGHSGSAGSVNVTHSRVGPDIGTPVSVASGSSVDVLGRFGFGRERNAQALSRRASS